MSLRLRNICKYGTVWATLDPLLLPLPLHNANSPSSGAIHFRFRLPYDIYGAHRTTPGSSPWTIYLPFILYSISGSLPFTGASRPARENGKLRPSFYQAALMLLLCVCPPGSVCYVHSSIPFHSFALRCFSCLRALPAFCFCVLWLARLVIFCTCSRLEYFMGLSAFS